MSLLSSGLNPKYLEAIKKFRLIDDTFFNLTHKKSPASTGGEMNCGFF